MKTNDLAKSLISRPNDFNELRHPKRNPRFVRRNIRFVLALSGFADARSETALPLGRHPRRSRLRSSRPGKAWIWGRAAFSKNAVGLQAPARKKLRKRAAKGMKSLGRVTLCAARGRVAASRADRAKRPALPGVGAMAPPAAAVSQAALSSRSISLTRSRR